MSSTTDDEVEGGAPGHADDVDADAGATLGPDTGRDVDSDIDSDVPTGGGTGGGTSRADDVPDHVKAVFAPSGRGSADADADSDSDPVERAGADDRGDGAAREAEGPGTQRWRRTPDDGDADAGGARGEATAATDGDPTAVIAPLEGGSPADAAAGPVVSRRSLFRLPGRRRPPSQVLAGQPATGQPATGQPTTGQSLPAQPAGVRPPGASGPVRARRSTSPATSTAGRPAPAAAAAGRPTAGTTPRPRPTRVRLRSQLPDWWRPGRILLVTGALLLLFSAWLFFITGFSHSRAQEALREQLDEALETAPLIGTTVDDDGNPVPLPAHRRGDPVALLQIPDLDLSEVVVSGTRNSDLIAGPGHLRASVLPGQIGNTVLIGRRSTHGGPFSDLEDLVRGAPIQLITEAGTFTYRVVGVNPFDPNAIGDLSVEDEAVLTLITSTPAYLPTDLLVVTAELESDPVPFYRALPAGIDRDEAPLTGEPVAALPLTGTLMLLMMSIIAAAWLWGGWSKRSTWLIGAPVIVALVVLTFEYMQRLLPATL